ncbi:MAG TPA: hypothetical protein VFA38_11325, partial [Nitrospirales bacterium]|nr:hypothetical protein [Nitrospirales bacterium]
AVARAGKDGERYLIGSGRPVLFKDVIDCLHRLTGRKSSITAVPPPRFHQVVGITNFSANISKISALGWAPKVDLEEGITRTLASYGS